MFPSPTTDLPQPPREPWEPEAPEHHTRVPDAPENGAETAEKTPAPRKAGKLNATVAKQLHDRLQVMLDRNQSYRNLLASIGVYDGAYQVGLKADLQSTLLFINHMDQEIHEAMSQTGNVLETLQNL